MIDYIATINQGGSEGDSWFHINETNEIPFKYCFGVLEYINLMCIAKKGRAFSLICSQAYNSCTYTPNFWGNTYRLTQKKRIHPELDRKVEQTIASLPNGVRCTKQLAELPSTLAKDQYSKMSPWYEYMWTTYIISEDYSTKIYEARNRLLKNTRILDELTDYFRKAVYQYKSEDNNCTFKFSKNTVSYPPYGSTSDLAHFGMVSFPDDFTCFCFADVLMQYIVEKMKDNVLFHDIKINWQPHSAYNESHLSDTWVSVRISYSRRYDSSSGLERWS